MLADFQKTAAERRRGREKSDRHRELGRNQRAANPAEPHRRRARRVRQRRTPPRRAQRGHDSSNRGGEDGQARDDQQRAPVNVECDPVREVGNSALQPSESNAGAERPHGGGDDSESQGLGEQLQDQPPA